MLDVVIGLVLIIALLSLVATVIRESMAGIRNSRGRNLARLVCSLVGDNKNLSADILRHPFLQSMAMELPSHHQRSPSYLSSDVFVTGFLAYLTQFTSDLRPASPAIFVQELKAKMPRELTASLVSLLPGVENDWPAFEKRLQAWFDAVAERSSGWYKRENQVHLFVIGFVLALVMNINPIVISKALWNDAALRNSAVAQAELALQAYQAQNGAQPQGAARPSPATMNVLSAPYRATDKALTTIRVLFDGAATTSDEALRSGAAQQALAPVRSAHEMRTLLTQERAASGADAKQAALRDEAAAGFDFRLAQLRQLVPEGAGGKGCNAPSYLPCPVLAQLDTAIGKLQRAIDEERTVRDAQSGDQSAAALLTSQCSALDPTPGMSALCVQLRNLGIFSTPGMPVGWSDANWPLVFGDCQNASSRSKSGARPEGCSPDSFLNLPGLGNWGIAIAGWLLTALGVTLGAPFWFDLLGKLVKMRASGVKPAEGGTAASAVGGGVVVTTPSTLTQSGLARTEPPPPASSDAQNDAERLLTEDEITRIQRNLGMSATQQNGRIDLATRGSIKAWQAKYGAAETGELTQAQIQHLLLNPTTMEDDGYVG